MSIGKQIAQTWNDFWYAPVSPVPMALFRIMFGLLVLQSLFHFGSDFSVCYGVHSLFPLESIANNMWNFEPHFDLLQLLPPYDWCRALYFGTIVVSAFMFTFGLGTRFAATFLFFGLCSLHTHCPFNLNTGDRYELIVSFLMPFSNAGDALSLDSLIKHRMDDWRNTGFEPEKKPAWVQRMLQVELALAYFNLSYSKLMSEPWRDGSAVYYAVRITDFRRFAPAFIFNSPIVCKLLTWWTLGVEMSLCSLIWIKRLRYWVLLAGVLLHFGIDLTMNIPVFQGLFIATYILFVDPEDLRRVMELINTRIEKVFGPAAPLSFDGTCPFCVRAVGLLQRLDIFRRVKPLDYHDEKNLAQLNGIDMKRAEHEMLVRTPGGWLGGFFAVRWMAWRLPLLWIKAPLLYLPGATVFGAQAYNWVATRRHSLLGPACSHTLCKLDGGVDRV
ncbi:MAG: DCC1-like thiol-disulfide oxidoreductase family protein [Terriglobales bacterium]